MPLPRFERLPPAEQARILDAAALLYADRPESFALTDLPERAGISRSALYTYFDGRDDLVRAVVASAVEAVSRALGPWSSHREPESFWADVDGALSRLQGLFAAQPQLRAVLLSTLTARPGGPGATAATGHDAGPDAWIDAVFDDAVAVGLVTASHRPLVLAATRAVFAAADTVELANPGSVTSADLRGLLTRLWS